MIALWRHPLYLFIKKKQQLKGQNVRQRIACTCDTFCALTQAWCVSCPITLSNYKHDVYTVLLVLKLSWRTQEFCYSFDQWNQGFWIATKHNNCTSDQFSGYAFVHDHQNNSIRLEHNMCEYHVVLIISRTTVWLSVPHNTHKSNFLAFWNMFFYI